MIILDLFEKISTKTILFCMMTVRPTVIVNYILKRTMEKNVLMLSSKKSFIIGPKTPKIRGNV